MSTSKVVPSIQLFKNIREVIVDELLYYFYMCMSYLGWVRECITITSFYEVPLWHFKFWMLFRLSHTHFKPDEFLWDEFLYLKIIFPNDILRISISHIELHSTLWPKFIFQNTLTLTICTVSWASEKLFGMSYFK